MARTPILILALTVLLGGTALAQSASVKLFQPPPNQLRIADLWRVQLFNNTREPIEILLRGTVTEARDGLVVEAESRTFTLRPGAQVVTGRELEPIDVVESDPKYRSIVTRTGSAPSGDYTICVFILSAETGEELGSDCIDHTIEILSPPILIAPTDEESLAVPLPIFTWTPPVPAPSSGARLTYRIRIAEILGRQSPYDAIRSNPAYYEQQNLRTPTFQYPGAARSFVNGRRYAWRVFAYDNGIEVGESEVWSFTRSSIAILSAELAEVDKVLVASIAGMKGDVVIAGKGNSATIVEPSSGGGGGNLSMLASSPVKKLVDGQVWSWGNNQYQQLGTGPVPAVSRSKPTAVAELDHTRDVALGAEHGLAIDKSGKVGAWGNNDYGQLGLGNYKGKPRPVLVPGLSAAVDVAAGNYHSVALLNSGKVWTWGYNRSGELGRGSTGDISSPGQVNLSNIVAVAAGDAHTLALASDGTVWSWGTNRYGQADPSTDGAPILKRPKKIDGLTKVKAIAAGGTFSMALLEDGTIRTWGSNNSGQLGNGAAEPGATLIKKMIVGRLALPSGGDGKEGPKRFRTKSTGGGAGAAVGGKAAVVKELELGLVLINLTGIVKVSSLTNVTDISAGGAHALSLRSDSTIWTWGNNYWGALGTGDRDFRSGPARLLGIDKAIGIAAGGAHSLGIAGNRSIFSWGSNASHQLGLSNLPASVDPEDEEYTTEPVVVPTL